MSGAAQCDADVRTLVADRCDRVEPAAFDQIEVRSELSRKRGNVVAAHVEPGALLGSLGGKRRDDQDSAWLHRRRCDGPIRLPVILFDEEVEHRAVVPELPFGR